VDSESSRGRDGVAAWRLRFDEAKVNPLNVGDPCVAVAIALVEFRREHRVGFFTRNAEKLLLEVGTAASLTPPRGVERRLQTRTAAVPYISCRIHR
jgi:hypothetical protein